MGLLGPAQAHNWPGSPPKSKGPAPPPLPPGPSPPHQGSLGPRDHVSGAPALPRHTRSHFSPCPRTCAGQCQDSRPSLAHHPVARTDFSKASTCLAHTNFLLSLASPSTQVNNQAPLPCPNSFSTVSDETSISPWGLGRVPPAPYSHIDPEHLAKSPHVWCLASLGFPAQTPGCPALSEDSKLPPAPPLYSCLFHFRSVPSSPLVRGWRKISKISSPLRTHLETTT